MRWRAEVFAPLVRAWLKGSKATACSRTLPGVQAAVIVHRVRTSTGQPNRVASPKSLRCLVWLCVCVRIAWYGTHRFLQQALRLLPTDDGLNLELGRLLTTVHDHTGAVKVQ
jgi:hypothetical protein